MNYRYGRMDKVFIPDTEQTEKKYDLLPGLYRVTCYSRPGVRSAVWADSEVAANGEGPSFVMDNGSQPLDLRINSKLHIAWEASGAAGEQLFTINELVE